MSISGTVVCKKRAGERSAEENSQKKSPQSDGKT